MKRLAILSAIVALVFSAILLAQDHDARYIYAVREKITTVGGGISFDVWCWKEYRDGRIKKEYMFSQLVYGDNLVMERVVISLCR